MQSFQRLLLCASLLLSTAVAAEDARPGVGELYWYVSVGGFNGDETAGQLENEDSSGALMAGIGVRPWRHVALEAEIAGFAAEYDRPPLSPPPGATFDSRMTVSSGGIAGNAKLLFELAGASVYAGAGIGLYGSEAELEGTLLGFDAVRVEDDSGFGYQLMAGAAVAVGKRSHLGLEYRRLELEADFGELSGGEVDVGGDYVGLTFRQSFGSAR